MRFWRKLKYGVLIAAAVVILAAVGLYLLASSVPSAYQPARLDPRERRQVADQMFFPRVSQFSNGAQGLEPFTWSVSGRDLNLYLGALDEIRTVQPGRKAGKVDDALARAGVKEPSVALGDGVITVMAQTTRYNKVISADVAFDFPAQGQVRVRLESVRVGRLPVPKTYVRKLLKTLRRQLVNRTLETPPGETDEGAEAALSVLDSIIYGDPVSSEVVWPYNEKRVRIDGIDIADDTLTIRATPTWTPVTRPAH